jgi:hypothetical protein
MTHASNSIPPEKAQLVFVPADFDLKRRPGVDLSVF